MGYLFDKLKSEKDLQKEKTDYTIERSNDPNYIDIRCFGTIDFSTITDDIEESAGKINFNKIGECKLYVYGKEGPIPHFHIKTTNGDLVCCVCLHKASYFDHGTEFTRLNSGQLKLLNNYLKTKNPKYSSKITIWEIMCISWNTCDDNPEYTNFPNKQPDYTKLNENKTTKGR